MLHEPDVLEAHLLGQNHLLGDLPEPLLFRPRRSGPGHLHFLEHSKLHDILPPGVFQTHWPYFSQDFSHLFPMDAQPGLPPQTPLIQS